MSESLYKLNYYTRNILQLVITFYKGCDYLNESKIRDIFTMA